MSEVLASAAHDQYSGHLEVVLRNGTKYLFSGVPADVYHGLMSAPSPGKFFSQNISRKLKGRRVL